MSIEIRVNQIFHIGTTFSILVQSFHHRKTIFVVLFPQRLTQLTSCWLKPWSLKFEVWDMKVSIGSKFFSLLQKLRYLRFRFWATRISGSCEDMICFKWLIIVLIWIKYAWFKVNWRCGGRNRYSFCFAKIYGTFL